MKQSKNWLILGLLGFILVAIAVAVLPVGGSGRVEALGATSCVGEQYDWLGRAELAVGQSFATGVAVPAVAGSQIVVSALSFSAEPFATSIVSVTVGGAAVLEDALLPGGEIVVSNIGAAPLVLTITIMVVMVQAIQFGGDRLALRFSSLKY